VRTEFHERAGIRLDKLPEPLWLDPHRVVRDCLADVDAGAVISVPGPVYKGLAHLARAAPLGPQRWPAHQASAAPAVNGAPAGSPHLPHVAAHDRAPSTRSSRSTRFGVVRQ
jgi:hypothetical protein